MTKFTISCVLGLLLCPHLQGAETVKVGGHRYPLQLESHGTTWKLTGSEHFRYKVVFSVFTAALYEKDSGGGRRLTFTYTRNLKAEDLRKQALNTLKNQHDEDILALYRTQTDKLQAAYQDVKAGDAYTLTVIDNKGIWLHLNDKEIFHSDNADFGYWYLGIWLGDPPISDSLKEALVN